MKIMTWNVDWFRKGKHSGKEYEYRKEDYNETVQNKIEAYIQNFLQEGDSLAIIQEYPEFLLNKEVGDKFGNNIIMYNKRKTLMRTIAVCPSYSGWNNKTRDFFEGKIYYDNRVVVMEKNGVNVVGVHMPDLRRNGDNELWKRLIEFCTKYNPDVICGDFNTDCEYVNNERCDQFYYLEELKNRGDYWEAQGNATRNEPNENPTSMYETHIDYIWVKKRIKTISYEIDKQNLLDHFPIIAEIDF